MSLPREAERTALQAFLSFSSGIFGMVMRNFMLHLRRFDGFFAPPARQQGLKEALHFSARTAPGLDLSAKEVIPESHSN
jgi:hypothetical protein